MRSPPPDYVLAMGSFDFDGPGGGPLDSVPGIPKRGEMSDLGYLVNSWDTVNTSGEIQVVTLYLSIGRGWKNDCGEANVLKGRSSSQPPLRSGTIDVRQRSVSSASTASMHRRMASDGSVASSGGYTMTSTGGRTSTA